MYYDTNIDESLYSYESEKLNNIEYRGIILNKKTSKDDLQRNSQVKTETVKNIKIYSRIELNSDELLSKKEILKALEYDIFSIKITKPQHIKRILEYEPDIITLDFNSKIYNFDEKEISEVIKKNIFIEISAFSLLHTKCKRYRIMKNIRALFKLTKGQNIILSSGARTSIELKRPWDLVKMLGVFKIPESQGKQFLLNSIGLLRNAALRRERNNQIETWISSELRKEFIIDY